MLGGNRAAKKLRKEVSKGSMTRQEFKFIRKNILKFTQFQMGAKLGYKHGSVVVSNFETGRRPINERVVILMNIFAKEAGWVPEEEETSATPS